MNGWLIYDEAGAKRNEWFIARLIEAANARGVALTLKTDCENWRLEEENLPDFAIVRTIHPALNKRLERLGVRCVNNAETSRVANDKWQTYLSCKEWGIPVLPTQPFTNINDTKKQEYPLVLKSTDGHGGAEVFWIEDERALKERAQTLDFAKKKYVLQSPCKTLGKDIRAYVIGGEIVACVLRESETSFKSNFSLGGKVCAVQADEEQKKIVLKLYEKLRFDYVGVDFLPSENGYVLNEIEDAAGARMLYETSDVDIVELFIDHIIKTGR